MKKDVPNAKILPKLGLYPFSCMNNKIKIIHSEKEHSYKVQKIKLKILKCFFAGRIS